MTYTSKLLRAIRISAVSITEGAVLAGATAGLCASAIAATPSQQQAIVQHGVGGPDILKLETVPTLDPQSGEILIRVYAAAINPVDWKRRIGEGDYAPDPTGLPGMIPGGDVAGVVEKAGSGVTGLKVGDPVFAVIPRNAHRLNGGYAQFAIAPIDTTVAKPGNVTYLQAAGLGIAAVTGVRAVMVTGVAKGQRVLVTGASGGVGSAAVQAAKARGAYVIGTASGRREEYLRSIGVDEFIDYTTGNFEDKVQGVDVVIDTVGDDTADRAFRTIRKHGNYISVAARNIESKCAAAEVKCASRGNAHLVGRPVFEEVGRLAATGQLNVHLDKVFPLAEAGEAQRYSEQGRTQGKIGLIVDPQNADRK